MSTQIGELRHRLTIEQPTRTDDEGGGAALAWFPFAHVWGAVEAISGSEKLRSDRMSGVVACTITIRNIDGITPSMRFRRDEDVYEIVSILDRDGRKRFLTCKCEQRNL